MKKLILSILVLLPCLLVAQDYVMWETTYLKPKAGHYTQLMEKVAEHNKKYHKEGATSAYVFFVTSGPNSNQLAWVMGPCTMKDFDKRGEDSGHFSHWFDEVLAHCDTEGMENSYWVREDDMSHMPEPDGVDRPIQRVRFFEVADVALFRTMQEQLAQVGAKTPGFDHIPRVLYRKRFVNADKWTWAMVSSHKSWADLDAEYPNMSEAFEKVHGAGTWAKFLEMAEKAVVSRQDEWREVMPDLNGPQPVADSGNN